MNFKKFTFSKEMRELNILNAIISSEREHARKFIFNHFHFFQICSFKLFPSKKLIGFSASENIMSESRNLPKISDFHSLLQEESPLQLSSDENTNPDLQKRGFCDMRSAAFTLYFLVKRMGPKVSEQQEMEMNYQDLETECLILRRQLPRLKDTQGKDVTNEVCFICFY